ncbi:MAG: outer membrane beta-barrel protein [Candidatus Latescibacteria bacterium]|jgi:opacity protein-like surface antigen|nr:outer membrane beta-barrel protein [Candidatus Latescibacterota bacterium]
MKMIITSISVCLLFVAAQPPPVQAWDGKRKGFILGAGGAIGRITERASTDIQSPFVKPSTTIKKLTYGFEVRLGYAFNQRNAVVFVREDSYMRAKNTFNDTRLFLRQHIGFGLTHWLKPAAPAFFLNGSIGWSHFREFSYGLASRFGFGAGAGLGYELTRHVSVQMSVTYLKAKLFVSPRNQFRDLSGRLSVVIMGY